MREAHHLRAAERRELVRRACAEASSDGDDAAGAVEAVNLVRGDGPIGAQRYDVAVVGGWRETYDCPAWVASGGLSDLVVAPAHPLESDSATGSLSGGVAGFKRKFASFFTQTSSAAAGMLAAMTRRAGAATEADGSVSELERLLSADEAATAARVGARISDEVVCAALQDADLPEGSERKVSDKLRESIHMVDGAWRAYLDQLRQLQAYIACWGGFENISAESLGHYGIMSYLLNDSEKMLGPAGVKNASESLAPGSGKRVANSC